MSMRDNKYLKFLIYFISVISSFKYSHAAEIPSDRIIKLDLASVYNTFFDIRRQLRVGLEYQIEFKNNLQHTFHLDFGQYDHYSFNKYHDFFNQNSGFYAIRQDVRTFGAHCLYGLKYTFKKSESRKFHYFSCLVSDFNFFKKHIKTFNELNSEKSIENNHQFRIGLGPEIGIETRLYKRFSLEIKTAILFNLITVKSKEDSPNIKPYKALWYDVQHTYWLIPRINLCYAL